jgi:hypothetical protein
MATAASWRVRVWRGFTEKRVSMVLKLVELVELVEVVSW